MGATGVAGGVAVPLQATSERPDKSPLAAARAKDERRSIIVSVTRCQVRSLAARSELRSRAVPLDGRGNFYSKTRAASEWLLARAYRGGWPARVVRGIGLQPRVRTIEHVIPCGGWPEGARTLRIAFVSDLHAGPTTHPSMLEDAVRALRSAAPDVLLLGGDYVYLHAEGIHELAPLLADLPAPLGRFGVFGNHDLWAHDPTIRTALERAGVRMLVNENVTLPLPFDHISICGLDDPWVGEPDMQRTLDCPSPVKVLLMHAPEGIQLIGTSSFDVAICGHTHGGHIALPGGIPIVVAGPLSRKYSEGRYDIGGRPMIVSRGIGATESALRLFADPDVRVLTLGPRVNAQ
jgi:predicted MPP superfamily phosphohydrolase